MIDQAIQEFATALGLRSLQLTPREPVTLEAEDIGRLTLLTSGNRLLLGITRAQEADSPNPGRLLAACHFREERAWPICPQASPGRYGFYAILEGTRITAQNIRLVFETMTHAMNQVHSR